MNKKLFVDIQFYAFWPSAGFLAGYAFLASAGMI
jgi:hypothetical protein|tara:strand:- start:3400 stop:3501 length:102 start_codon:yes stop_codon:yes gene_type:complete